MIDRRAACGLIGAAFFGLGGARAAEGTGDGPMTRADAYDFTFPGIEGTPIRLADYRGQVLLVVNTACQCGYTPQFGALQRLAVRYRLRGFTVIGVPSNDFGGQDPGSDAEIAAFAANEYGVSFPMASKQVVIGPDAHPFYRWAARERPGETPRWNFHKYLIGRDGRIVGVFPTAVTPEDPRLLLAIERALGTPKT